MTIAEKLINYRAKKNISQKKLGKLLGVNKNQVGRWETGATEPRAITKIRIENLINAD